MKNVMTNRTNGFMYVTLAVLLTVSAASAWINGVGSPSTDPNNPVIGTHDRMLNSAIGMLPTSLQSKIDTVAADYGTEMPDYNSTMCNCIYGLRDQKYHQVYYYSNGTLQDNSSARRAQEEYNLAMTYSNVGDKYNFSIHVGMMSHYMADISNFAHTMGNNTDWNNEGLGVHGRYENFVAGASNKFFSSTAIKFDGKYDNITAYNATLDSANDTTFDNKFGDGTYNSTWMYDMVNSSDSLTYASADQRLIDRTRQSLNYNVNLMTDVIYTMVNVAATPTPSPTPNATATPVPTATPKPSSGSSSSSSGSSGSSDSSSSSSSSGGGGGGGAGTAEPYDNILKYEVQERQVSITPVSFKYATPDLVVYEEIVTSTQSDMAALRVEVLKDTSSLVAKPAPGVIYKNINAWIDYKRTKNVTMKFKVENSWIDENGLSSENVKMLRWDNSSQEWIKLQTSVTNKDDKYAYFESQTGNVSGQFATGGIKDESTTVNVEPPAGYKAESVPAETGNVEEVPVGTGILKAPGFDATLLIVSIVSIVYLSRRITR